MQTKLLHPDQIDEAILLLKAGDIVALPTETVYGLAADAKNETAIKKIFIAKNRPLHDRVVVRRMEEETKTAGGIVLPDSATEKPSRGEVLAVGPGKTLDNGDVRAVGVKVGDKVVFGQYAGSTVKIDGEELLILSETELFGVLEG